MAQPQHVTAVLRRPCVPEVHVSTYKNRATAHGLGCPERSQAYRVACTTSVPSLPEGEHQVWAATRGCVAMSFSARWRDIHPDAGSGGPDWQQHATCRGDPSSCFSGRTVTRAPTKGRNQGENVLLRMPRPTECLTTPFLNRRSTAPGEGSTRTSALRASSSYARHQPSQVNPRPKPKNPGNPSTPGAGGLTRRRRLRASVMGRALHLRPGWVRKPLSRIRAGRKSTSKNMWSGSPRRMSGCWRYGRCPAAQGRC